MKPKRYEDESDESYDHRCQESGDYDLDAEQDRQMGWEAASVEKLPLREGF